MAHLVPWILALVCCLDYCFGQDYPQNQASTPHPRIYRKYIETHLLDGTLKKGFHTEAACLAACQSDPHCIAVDFNHLTKFCFFHGEKSACGKKLYKHGCTHYAMTNYCTTTIKQYSVVQMEVDNEYDIVHIEVKVDNYHGHGAIFQYKGGHLAACVADCKNSSWCKGVDFSTYGNTCWFHSEKTICNKLAYKYDCMHVRIMDDCSTIKHEGEKYGPDDTGYGKQGHGVGPYEPEGYEMDEEHPDKDPKYAEEGDYSNIPIPGLVPLKPHHREGPDYEEKPYDGQRPDYGDRSYDEKRLNNREGPYDREIPDYEEGPYDGKGPGNRVGPYDAERPDYGEGPYDGKGPDNREEPYDGERPDYGEGPYDGERPDYEEGPYDGERPDYGEGPYDGKRPDNRDSYEGDKLHLGPEPDYDAKHPPRSPIGHVAYGVFYAAGQGQPTHIGLLPLPGHLVPVKSQQHGKGPEYGPNPPVDHIPDVGHKPPHVDGPKLEHTDEYVTPHGEGLKPEHSDGYMPPHVVTPEHGDRYIPPHDDGQKPAHGAGYKPPHGNGQKPAHGNGYKPPHGDGQKPAHGDGQKPAHGDGYKPPHNDGYKPKPTQSYKPQYPPKPTPGYPHHKNPLYGLTTPAPPNLGYPNGGSILPTGRYPIGHPTPTGPSSGYQNAHGGYSSVDQGSSYSSSEQGPQYPRQTGPVGPAGPVGPVDPVGLGEPRYNQEYNQPGPHPGEAGKPRYSPGKNEYNPVNAGHTRHNQRQYA